MGSEREIRADYDRDSIVIYQAYPATIADAAIGAGRFVAPFSFTRMTWIKPSFLWLMHRSNWGNKAGQERTLAVRMSRVGWDKALAMGVVTSYEPTVFRSPDDWSDQFRRATVHVQWDTERSLRGAALPMFSIQVGLSRHFIREFVDDWILGIDDLTPRVATIRTLLRSGQAEKARRHLPAERAYPVTPAIGRMLLVGR